MTEEELIQQAAEMIQSANKLAVLTGAGVSKESGVPTFRDALDGLWAKYNPEQLATPMAFTRDPKLVWDWYTYRRQIVANADPNPGHDTLAKLEQRVTEMVVITQNVDDLHEQAGSQHVIHLHGNIAQSKCFDHCQGKPTIIDLSTIEVDPENTPPRCPHCGAWVRPDVVWFTESLPEYAFSNAMSWSQDSDVMLVVGTSGIVTPAALLPEIAKNAGAHIIEVNPDDTMITRIAEIKLTGPSGEVLPKVLKVMVDD